MNKTKKAIKARNTPVSLFGINDCHKPKRIQKGGMNIEFVTYTNVQKL